jgi:hypothetical protein
LVSIPSSPEVKVLVIQNPEEHTLYPYLSLVGSPIYASCKSKEVNPRFPFPPSIDFVSPDDCILYFPLPHPEEVERSPLWSIDTFENPHFESRSSSPIFSMAVVGGGQEGEGGARGRVVKGHLHRLGFLLK